MTASQPGSPQLRAGRQFIKMFNHLHRAGLLVLTTFISSSPGLAMPSTLAPDRRGAGSRRSPSRDDRPPGKGEVTLSQELRTARLLRPHVLVGSGGRTPGQVLVVVQS